MKYGIEIVSSFGSVKIVREIYSGNWAKFHQRKGKSGMKKMKLISAFTVVVLCVIVILQNTQPVETMFLFFKITMPNAILLGLALMIGISMGILIAVSISGRFDAKKK